MREPIGGAEDRTKIAGVGHLIEVEEGSGIGRKMIELRWLWYLHNSPDSLSIIGSEETRASWRDDIEWHLL